MAELNRQFLKDLWKALREDGFKRDYSSASGGIRVVVYVKRVDARRSLECQVWYDGLCRISSDFNGCSDTRPTEFSTLKELAAAIYRESTRTDSRWCVALPKVKA